MESKNGMQAVKVHQQWVKCAARAISAAAVVAAIAVFAVTVRDIAYGQSDERSKRNLGWGVYGGTPDNTHYSPLAQINKGNVAQLKVAWSYDTGEVGGLETNPLIVKRVVYGYSPQKSVIALDAVTGKLIWRFSSGVHGARPERGVSYWEHGTEHRIFAPIANYLYALDATTGKPILSFGDSGRIDLREGLRDDPKTVSIYATSPGAIYKDLIIIGGAEPEQLPAAPGDIRAFDCLTGKLRWTFHTIPHPGEFGYETWPKDAWKYSGAANNWTGMTIDQKRGIVYVPTGSPATDWYGADRIGDNLFSDSIIALNASTGERLWHFQGIHHDLWDRDFPAPPALVTLRRNGRDIPAVAQTSKQGYLYVFNRADGKPLFPMKTQQYPASTVPGEITAKEQTLPTMPEPFARQVLTEDMLTNRTPEIHEWALQRFRTMISNGQFTPNRVDKDTVMFPSWIGGAEYGGPAFDPKTHTIYINSNDTALTESLAKGAAGNTGKGAYLQQCASCHGQQRTGSPPAIPSLIGVEKKMSAEQVEDLLDHGRGRMPSFPNLEVAKRKSIVNYVLQRETDEGSAGTATSGYNTTGYKMFVDPDGYPAVAPPWGTLSAIDLNTGAYLWKIPFGEYPALVAKGMKDTGTENFGGPVVTGGGLLIIAASVYDRKLRIYDKSTGHLLWETQLPFSALSTPSTYAIDGKQYIVVASGGGRDHSTPTGGVYVAFSLP